MYNEGSGGDDLESPPHTRVNQFFAASKLNQWHRVCNVGWSRALDLFKVQHTGCYTVITVLSMGTKCLFLFCRKWIKTKMVL